MPMVPIATTTHPLLRAVARGLLTLLPVGLMCAGCLTRLTVIHAPANVDIEEEFVVAVDGIVSGTGGGTAGIVLQVPESFELLGASYLCSDFKRPLRRLRGVESKYYAEEGYAVLALGDSLPYATRPSDTLRAFLRFRAGESGSFTITCASGAVDAEHARLVWRALDPVNVWDFSEISDPKYRASITVGEAERNGTAAILFSGAREYVALPDTGLFAWTMEQDFSVECWIASTARDAVLFSTRSDDFLTAFPFELFLDNAGSLQVSASDGSTLHVSRSTAFVSDGTWRHIALTWEASTSTFTLYVDAVPVDELQVSERVRGVPHASLLVAGRPSKRKFYAGIIDELRFWSVRRTRDEIIFYKNVALTGFERNLVAFYTFDTGQDGRIVNTSGEGMGDAVAYNRPKLVPSLAPLKIELLSFSVTLAGSDVEMAWESFDDTQVRYYEVEKRTAAGKYVTLRRLEPEEGAKAHHVFRITDVWQERSVVYYRLRKANTDGSVLFSDEVPVGEEHILTFTLGDNEPNPFSTVTEIPFTVTESSYLSLEVYDLMGRKVAQLVSERKGAGAWSVPFDGSALPGGVYFYKMRSSDGSVTKKMYISRQ